MIGVAGIGWIAGDRYGAERCGLEGSFRDAFTLRDELLARGVLPYPIKRFAKFDDVCRMASLVAALSLHDGRIELLPDQPLDVAVLGTNGNGCLRTNRDFYADFVEHGRKRGRGSLFVYTLASMPFAEVSMYWKFVGPAIWLGGAEPSRRPMLERASAMLRRGDVDAVLALDVDEIGGIGFLLNRESGSVDLASVLRSSDLHATTDELVEGLRESRTHTPQR